MLNYLTFSLLFALSTVFFNFSGNVLHVKSVWSGINATLVQDAVLIPSLKDDSLEAMAPCFDTELLESLVLGSLKDNLAPYLNEASWSVSFLYSAYQVDESYPQAVDLSFEANYYGAYTYHGAKSFTLKKGASYGQ
jgi:hypothetical protein